MNPKLDLWSAAAICLVLANAFANERQHSVEPEWKLVGKRSAIYRWLSCSDSEVRAVARSYRESAKAECAQSLLFSLPGYRYLGF